MIHKNIIYDARHIENEWSGLARYTFYLLDGLISLKNKNNKVVVILRDVDYKDNLLYKKLVQLVDLSESLEIRYVKYKCFSIKNYIFMANILNKYNDYEYVYPHFDKPWGVKIPSKSILHDLFPLVVDDYFVKNIFIKKAAFYLLCFFTLKSKRNDIITISNSTKNDILRFFPFIKSSNIRVVLSSDCLGKLTEVEAEQGKYIFYVGDRRPHKNLKNMLDIYSIMKSRYFYGGDFIIAGSMEDYDFVLNDYIKGMSGVKVVGKVSEQELQSYYKGMEALFFLSKYEGFGLPVLEASKFNRKIITSNVSSLPEVSPDTALMLSPFEDTAVNAILILNYLNKNICIDNTNFLKNFSWSKTALGVFYNE